MFILLLFLVQTLFHPLGTVPLAGAEAPRPTRELTLSSWFGGDFQRTLSRNINGTFGFRSHCVRLFNQLNFSLFGEVNPRVAVGEEGYLFERAYEASPCGSDRMEGAEIGRKVDSLARLDALLRERGKRLYLVIAPNKWRSHSDKAPWSCEPSGPTNYDRFREGLHRHGIATLDCIERFEAWRAEAEHPLYSPFGTHWSIYGGWRVAGELRDRLALDGFDMPRLDAAIRVSDTPRNTDKDLHDLLNIMAPPPRHRLAYPEITVSGEAATRALVVGDSYYWTFFYLDLHERLWAPGSPFLYYNRNRYLGIDRKEAIRGEQRSSWIDAADVVVLITHEAALKRLGYGFLGDALTALEQ